MAPVKLFELGRVFATPGALESVSQAEIFDFLKRHSQGDWGTVDDEDWETNDLAVSAPQREAERRKRIQAGTATEDDEEEIVAGRIFSAYEVEGERIWIITEAVGEDGTRSSTCVLTPSEY